MSKKEYHKIGEVFELNGMRLKVYNANDFDCALCTLGRKGVNGCNEMACNFKDRADSNDVIFMETTEPLTDGNHIDEANKMEDTLKLHLTVLKEVIQSYQGKTIDNIVMQMEARVKEMEKGDKQ